MTRRRACVEASSLLFGDQQQITRFKIKSRSSTIERDTFFSVSIERVSWKLWTWHRPSSSYDWMRFMAHSVQFLVKIEKKIQIFYLSVCQVVRARFFHPVCWVCFEKCLTAMIIRFPKQVLLHSRKLDRSNFCKWLSCAVQNESTRETLSAMWDTYIHGSRKWVKRRSKYTRGKNKKWTQLHYGMECSNDSVESRLI